MFRSNMELMICFLKVTSKYKESQLAQTTELQNKKNKTKQQKTNPIKKPTQDLNKQFSKENIQKANRKWEPTQHH